MKAAGEIKVKKEVGNKEGVKERESYTSWGVFSSLDYPYLD